MIFRRMRRGLILVTGLSVMLLGVILIPLPGPGLLIVLGGLVLLAREFTWARRYVDMLKSYKKRLTTR